MQDFWTSNQPFPATTEEDWRALVEQTIERAAFERKLVHTDLDGCQQQPVYTQAATSAAPGQFPYTRGPASNTEPGWQICQTYDSSDPLDSNRQLLHELSGGVSAIELTLNPLLAGVTGIRCPDLRTLETALNAVQLELLHVALTPAAANITEAALMLALYRRRGTPAAAIRFALNADPLGSLARAGTLALPGPYQHIASTLAQYIDHHYPASTSLCADGTHYHNSGASPAQQVGLTIATAVAYLRAITDAGLSASSAAAQLEFRLALDAELFESIAIQRAIRQLWSMVLEQCGVEPADCSMTLRAVSGNRCLSQRDPAVNMLRVTSQTLAAALGGASSFNSAAFDLLSTGGSDKGRRIARNTQLILMEESGLHRVRDPLGGAGHIEALTTQLAQTAWQIVQQIESAGGMYQALQRGTVQQLIQATRSQRERALANGASPITGVSEFPNLDETRPAKPPKQPQSQASPATTSAPLDSDLFAYMITAYHDGRAPLTAELNNTDTIDALPAFRDAAIYEQLRDRADRHHDQTGAPPQLTLITIGEPSDYGARVTFSQNFFAVAGIHCTIMDVQQWLQQPRAGALCVLCSSDQRYAEQARDACTSVLAAGAVELWLAGKAGPLETELSAAGLAEQLYIGCDRVALLTRALATLEVA